MFRALNAIFEKKLTHGITVLLLVIAAQAIYFYMIFVSIPTLETFTHGLTILDMLPTGYTATYVHELFNALGVQGRDFYLYHQIPIDLLYPAFFAISNSALLLYLFKKAAFKQYRFICFTPFIVALFDYIENLCTAHMLFYFPDFHSGFPVLASIATVAKSIFTLLFFGILIYYLFATTKNALRRKHHIDITIQ